MPLEKGMNRLVGGRVVTNLHLVKKKKATFVKHDKTRYACNALMIDSRELCAPLPYVRTTRRRSFMNWKWDPTRLQICVHLLFTLAVLYKDYEK